MQAKAIAIVLAFSASPAAAKCHMYSHWYYPWKQSCNAKVAFAYVPVPKIVLKEQPDPPVKEQEVDPTEILNAKLKLHQENNIPDIPVNILIENNSIEAQRKKALEKIKTQLH
jgi:hypothetical protein